MKSLDTNVLARFFIDDPDDAQAVLQRPAAVLALSESSLVTVTVILEFEWVMRGFYGLARTDILRVLTALLGMQHIDIEDRDAVTVALSLFEAGRRRPEGPSTIRTTCLDCSGPPPSSSSGDPSPRPPEWPTSCCSSHHASAPTDRRAHPPAAGT